MRWKILVISILVTIAAVAASAEVKVTIGHEPLELGSGSAPELDPSVRMLPHQKGVVPSKKSTESTLDRYAVPHFRVDTVNPFGDTTLLAVRNESTSSNTVTVDIHDAPWNTLVTLTRTLAHREIWSLNLRDHTSAIPVDSDGYRRGEALVRGALHGNISLDWFQVNPDQDFAVGGTGINYTRDYCNTWKVRSLIGGGFSGGTSLTFNLNTSCIVAGNTYTEAGTFANSFTINAGQDITYTVNTSFLTGTSASSMEIDLSSCGSGWVAVVHDAEGRYSVGVDGICLD